MDIRIAIASDLHCHPKDHSPQSSFLFPESPKSPVGDHPIESLIYLIREERLRCDFLLTPGDITNQVDQGGLNAGWTYLKELRDELGCSRLLPTLGNHDVDSRKLYGPDAFDIAKHFSPRDFPSPIEEERDRFWRHGYFIADEDSATILVVNSVYAHHNEEEAKRGKVSVAQLDTMKEDILRTLRGKTDLQPRLAVVHHHPIPHEGLGLESDDLMVLGSELLALLEELRFGLVIHGHKHYPRLRYAAGGADSPVVLAAGSLSAVSVEMLSNTRNLFHIVELASSTVSQCSFPGTVHSWQFNKGRGWRRPEGADFPAVAGFGFRGPIRDLSDQISSYLGDNSVTVATWEDIRQSFPQVSFLLPDDLSHLIGEVCTSTRRRAFPGPPEQPEYLVRE